jgi:2-dehydro-3-deoxygalactonokinase
MTQPNWIAVDWGTTHLRVWLMADHTILDSRFSDRGMGQLTPDQFEPTLRELLGSDLTRRVADAPLPVLICGMAGSRQGWAEAPYVSAPCPPPGITHATKLACDGLNIHILPGIKQHAPADVMRGEETQIAGFLAQDPDFQGILCLPGTHTKWVQISAGEITRFSTFMTGELFALLSQQSVLRHSVGSDRWDQAGFDAALAQTLSTPADLAARLFSLRAEGLLQDLPAATAKSRLSALLIGAELSAARSYWLGQPVVVIGEGGLCDAYFTALQAQGGRTRQSPAQDITLAGLLAAWTTLQET